MGQMIDNNQNKQNTQTRIIIATVISLLFFLVYDFLYLQPQLEKEKANKSQEITKNPATFSVNTNKNAPSLESSNNNNAIGSNTVTTIKTAKSLYEIDNLGRISQVTLTTKTYQDAEHHAIKLFNSTQLKPLEVRFADPELNTEAFKTNIQSSVREVDASNEPVTVIIKQNLSKTILTKEFVFYPDGHYDIKVSTSNQQTFFITPGYRPDVLVDLYADHGALLVNTDETLTIIEDEDLDKNIELLSVQAVSAFDRYYTTVLYNFTKSHKVSVIKNQDNSPESFIYVDTETVLHGYAGPKEYVALKNINQQLPQIIEYGFFTFLAKPMFAMMLYIYGFIGNWGWTIVFVTILIKLILFPLSYKGMVSMNKLKELAPKIKAIQEKYKDDKQKSSMHMMELYKKEGANPMGGCLPILLQIPVFFAIYRVLTNAIELKGSEWILWIDDLSVMDPYFILPILMGATMYIQQKITPTQIQDEMQQKLFQFLPVIFTIFFLWFPAGLTLYWFINNLFTVAQQYYINELFAKNKVKKKEENDINKNKVK